MNDDILTKFLLVEDDDDHAHLTLRSFKRSALANHVDRVADGVEALEYLRREGAYADKKLPDVVLLDLKLPRKGGLEVLEEIRGDDALKHLLVVILTTSPTEADREVAYRLGVNSYLVKPVDFDKFAAMVKDLSLYWGVWNRPSPMK